LEPLDSRNAHAKLSIRYEKTIMQANGPAAERKELRQRVAVTVRISPG
jgi:hypothetical protein